MKHEHEHQEWWPWIEIWCALYSDVWRVCVPRTSPTTRSSPLAAQHWWSAIKANSIIRRRLVLNNDNNNGNNNNSNNNNNNDSYDNNNKQAHFNKKKKMLWIWSRLILSTQTLAVLIIAIFCNTTDEDVLQTCEYSESSHQLRDLLGDFMKWLQEGIATLFYRFSRRVSFLGVRLSRTTGAPMKTLSSIFPIT